MSPFLQVRNLAVASLGPLLRFSDRASVNTQFAEALLPNSVTTDRIQSSGQWNRIPQFFVGYQLEASHSFIVLLCFCLFFGNVSLWSPSSFFEVCEQRRQQRQFASKTTVTVSYDFILLITAHHLFCILFKIILFFIFGCAGSLLLCGIFSSCGEREPGETMETVTTFIFLGSKITVNGDCSHEIKRHFLLGRKAMTNLDSILKS